MKSDDRRFLFRKEILNGAIVILGVLLLLVLFFQPGTAAVSANFTVKNQAGMTLFSGNHSGALSANYSCNDILYCNDISSWNGTDTIGSWNWTIGGVVRSPIFDPSKRNVTYDTTLSAGDPITVQLIAANQTGLNSSSLTVDFYKYGPCGNITARMMPKAAYDDRALDPNGTVTFYDLSYSKIDPELNVTEWWWKGTNKKTGEEKNLTGKSQFTMNMSKEVVYYDINLTVGANGNYTTISKTFKIPPDNVMPIANFSAVPMAGVGPLNVSVIDQSKSMVNYTMSNVSLSYEYDVYDSTGTHVASSTEKNPVFLLSDPGIYNITSYVENWYGESDETSVENIQVYPGGLVANFSSSVREGLAPLNFTLIDQSIGEGPLAYNWTIGNSTWTSERRTEHNPQFKIPYTGKYWVNLSIIDQHGETDYENKTDFINVGVQRYPTADFAAVPENGTVPLNVSFIDQSVLDPDLLANLVIPNYTWSFGDGGSSHEKNPTHLYTEAGDYTVRLFVQHGEQEYSSENVQPNAVDSKEHMVHAYEPSNEGINFTWIQDYGKSPYSIVLIPLGITADWDVTWTIEGGEPATSNDFTPRVVYPGTGKYTVTLAASKDGLNPDPIERELEVFPDDIPHPDMKMMNKNPFDEYFAGVNTWAYGFVGDPIQFWSNESDSWEDSWEWDFGDNSSSSLRSPVHKFTAPGLYTVHLKSSNVHGVNESLIKPDSDQYDSYNVWILNTAVLSNVWAKPASGDAPLDVQFNADLSVNGKSDKESQDYVAQWLWFFGDGMYYPGTSLEQRPNHTYQYPGTYSPWVMVILKDGMGWTENSNDVTVYPPSGSEVTPGFTYDMIDRNGTYGYSYKFMDTSIAYDSLGEPCVIDKWLWDFGDGSPAGVERAPTHMFKEPGNYTITLTVQSTACEISGTISKEIYIPYFGTFASDQIFFDPVAGFTYAKVDNEPLALQFIDQSYGATPLGYAWSFGDTLGSSEKSPKHTYSSVGTYEVSLTVTDEFNKTNTIAQSIAVPPVNPPAAAFTYELNDVNPLQVQFTDTSKGEIYSWQWSFDDGLGSSTQSPEHLFSDYGTYEVTLTAGNSAGSDSVTQEITIENPTAKAGFTTENLADRKVKFTDTSSGSILSWVMEYGDGDIDTFTSGDWSPVEHQYSQKGIYPARLTVKNSYMSDSYSARITVT
ncbi:PKD domain-containing protein [Methanospirillum stamsii]|uniref:PKD domain-containing protein n=1 Tax=Methanospirillum stamsii TaxID=1277351 RepID=A0A2V2N8R9_9EURY|nr:PKD domain-containing protein [Methanospirillum stamsii]PWR76239.1 hypothetical protein DLD82_00035 [Methanospirillum stamsii]